MDIERLKELKGITEQLYQDGNVPLTYCDDVLGTIDEAIAAQSDKHPMAGTDPDADDWGNGYSRGYADGLQARQIRKPSDADVAEAIEWLIDIKEWEDVKYAPEGAGFINLAIDALRQYQKPTDTKILDAINKLTYARDSDREFDDGTLVEALDTALACMRQMRSEPCGISTCEWCFSKEIRVQEQRKHEDYDYETGELKDKFWTWDVVPHKYCPNCGRKLVK